MHPKTVDRFRTFLARNSLLWLIAYFVALMAFLALPLAECYRRTASADAGGPFLLWWRYAFLQVMGVESSGVSIQHDSLQGAVYLVGSILGLIVPALFLGAVVFKLLIARHVLTYRKRLSVCPRKSGDGYRLAVRLYNSSKLLMVDLEFKLYLRIRYVRSGEQPYLRNLPLRIDKPNWPIAKSHVPYALSVPLDEGDVSKDEKGRPVLVQIQGQALQSQNELLVLVHAMVPEMGGDFVEEHWYRIPKDVAFGRYHEISVDYDRPSRSWRGWRVFEKSQEFEWAEGDG